MHRLLHVLECFVLRTFLTGIAGAVAVRRVARDEVLLGERGQALARDGPRGLERPRGGEGPAAAGLREKREHGTAAAQRQRNEPSIAAASGMRM